MCVCFICYVCIGLKFFYLKATSDTGMINPSIANPCFKRDQQNIYLNINININLDIFNMYNYLGNLSVMLYFNYIVFSRSNYH